ncbi:MAG: hypothetical protein KIS66_04245 [Fimbriimonadaceae bacterium]|nr:hypothetical protein [Fimbriimonadaceae bacterium]
MTEFDARAKMAHIEASTMPPMRKVRALLRLRRAIRLRLRALSVSLAAPIAKIDRDAATRMTRLLDSLHRLDNDVQDAAQRALASHGAKSWIGSPR